jgi:hypothetical protein
MFLFPESDFAGSPLLLTAPLSLLCVFLPLDPGAGIEGAAEVTAVAVFAVWLLLCALVNAAVLGALATRAATAHRPARVSPSRAPRTRPSRRERT